MPVSAQITLPADAPELFRVDGLRDQKIAVLGYGNQGSAHADTLRASGLNIVIGARSASKAGQLAMSAGFEVRSIEDAVTDANLCIVALPDEVHGPVFDQSIGPNLRAGATLGFIHGFSIRFGTVQPPKDVGVVMVAPKGPGTLVRSLFDQGRGLPCLIAIEQDPCGDAESIAFSWATGIGAGRAGVIRTTFADEAETDLFGEQAVLCGGVTHLILAAFETLVEAGYSEQLAYLECCHELKQVADLIYERGLQGMQKAISNTAEFGAATAGPRVVDDQVRATMRRLLDQIRDGTFAREFIADTESGSPKLTAARSALAKHRIDRAGETVRSLMPWLVPGPTGDPE